MDNIFTSINKLKIVPVVVLNKTEETIPVLKNLKNGGLPIAEITFRTECAAECIELANKEFKDMIIGAGTIINAKQAEKAINCGAKFIVGPGFSAEVCVYCKEKNIPYIPGCVTPTEIMTAISYGLKILKFFPANIYGGIKTLKSFSSVFPSIKFIPTGGVEKDNLTEFLQTKNVFAVGGSWMAKGNENEILTKTAEAVNIINNL